MTSKAVLFSFPWRRVVPRKDYFRLLRMAKTCPEIRPNIDREAMLKGAEAVLFLPYLAVWVVLMPFFLLAALALVVTQVMPQPPDFSARRMHNSAAAEQILPTAEVRRRMGDIA